MGPMSPMPDAIGDADVPRWVGWEAGLPPEQYYWWAVSQGAALGAPGSERFSLLLCGQFG
jgi:hypothetical protein